VSGVDRTRPPAPGALRPFEFPAFRRERLASGLEIVLAPRSEVPLVEILLQLPAGGDRNPLDRPGLSALTASLLDEGTARRSGPEIAAAIERLGGDLATRADWNCAEVEVGLLARDLEAGLELVAELVREPVFPEEELERLRKQALAELLRRRDQPAVLAEEALAAALYPGTPYGALILGDEAAMAAIGRDEVRSFHADHYRPHGTSLVIVGDFDPEPVRRRIDRIFGDWRTEPPAAAREIAAAAVPHRRVVIVDRPAAAQTELRVVQPGVPRTHPDRTRLGLLNAILGGKFTSRLNLNLRERHGFTYGVHSRFVDRRGPGPFVVATAVANPVAGAAAREVLAELERIRREPVAPEELEETRSYIVGVFPYTLQTTSAILSRLAELALWGFPDDHYDRALAEIRATSAEDVLALAERHLRPDRLTLVAVGPATELEPQLAELGAVEVRKLD
jgi:zinc protease